MRRLRRGPHLKPVSDRIVARQHRAAFERHGAAAVEKKLRLEHVRRVPERRLDVAVAHGHVSRNVGRNIAVHARRAGRDRVARIAHRRKHFVIHLHRRSRIFRQITAVGDNNRNCLPDVADLLARQRKLRARRLDRRVRHQHGDLPVRHARRQIVGDEHRMHARHRPRGGRVDRADARMRVRRSHETGVQRSRQRDVVHETGAAGEQRRILRARHPRAEMLGAHGISRRRRFSAGTCPRIRGRLR